MSSSSVPGAGSPHAAAGDALPHYDARRVAEAAGLAPPCVEVIGSIGSTSTELMSRPLGPTPAAAPHALLAIEQTAGRGRRGRGWAARPASSMMLSVAIERALAGPARPYQALPLALGAAIADALAGFGCVVRLKWPNDLQREQRKVAGLLVEARRSAGVERVVVGLGLNLLPDSRRDAAVDQPVGALFDAAEAMPERSALAGTLIAAIAGTCARNAADGLAPFLSGWRARDALAGRPVRILEPDGPGWEGLAAGIDDDGALRVRTAGGERRVVAGDVSVRIAGGAG